MPLPLRAQLHVLTALRMILLVIVFNDGLIFNSKYLLSCTVSTINYIYFRF